MTTAMEVKKAIKESGINTKGISVRKSYGGYSVVFHITVKDLTLDLKAIKKSVRKFKQVDYDEVTGETLEGGNTYIFVEYDDDTMEEAKESKKEEAEEILANINNQINESYIKVKETENFIITASTDNIPFIRLMDKRTDEKVKGSNLNLEAVEEMLVMSEGA